MDARLLPAIVSLLLPFAAAAADPPELTPPEMQQILRALRTNFAEPDAAGFTALNRLAIDGLLHAHPQTMQLLTLPEKPAPVPPPVSESLTPRVACLRPMALRHEDAEAVRILLTKLAAGETAAVILDLRAPGTDGDPAAAAEFAGLFLPKATPLFSLTTPVLTTTDPVWTRDLMVLADADTGNSGEILTAVLRASGRGMVVGSPTRGRTVTLTDLPLRKTEAGQLTLRYAAARVKFGEGVTDPFGKGIVPDLAVPQTAEAKAAAWALQAKEGLARGVFQPARPRNNEAALVAKTSPELPERIARTAGRPGAGEAGPADAPLQVAVDVLVAREVLAVPERK